MPNFVKLDSKPFDRDTYVGPDQTDDTLSGNAAEVREKSMSIKLEVENTIRWRWKRIGPDPSNVVSFFLIFFFHYFLVHLLWRSIRFLSFLYSEIIFMN